MLAVFFKKKKKECVIKHELWEKRMSFSLNTYSVTTCSESGSTKSIHCQQMCINCLLCSSALLGTGRINVYFLVNNGKIIARFECIFKAISLSRLIIYQKVNVIKHGNVKTFTEQIESDLVGIFSHLIWEPEICLNIKK